MAEALVPTYKPGGAVKWRASGGVNDTGIHFPNGQVSVTIPTGNASIRTISIRK